VFVGYDVNFWVDLAFGWGI